MGEILTKELHLVGEAATLAAQLVDMRGVPVQAAVAEALRREISREQEIAAKTARILELAADVRAHMTPPLPTSDHSWLYDENGLPI